MADVVTAAHSVEVPVNPERAFQLYTAEIDRWWKRGTYYWNDRARAQGLRFEPFVGGRFIEVYDVQTGEGFEIGRIQVWEPGRRLVHTWRQADWPAGEQTIVEVLFEPVSKGTLVTVTHRGWEKITGGKLLRDGYEQGLRDLLGWYAEEATQTA